MLRRIRAEGCHWYPLVDPSDIPVCFDLFRQFTLCSRDPFPTVYLDIQWPLNWGDFVSIMGYVAFLATWLSPRASKAPDEEIDMLSIHFSILFHDYLFSCEDY